MKRYICKATLILEKEIISNSQEKAVRQMTEYVENEYANLDYIVSAEEIRKNKSIS